MSRLGDMIRSQRIKYNMTAKQLARKCGVSEAFVLEIESGKRIANDIIATRMLKAMGPVDEVMPNLDVQAAQEPQEPVRPAPVAKKEKAPTLRPEGEVSDAWKDALSGVIKRVPVLDQNGKTVGHRMLAAPDGRIEGARAETVFYFAVPDDTMRTYRFLREDLLLCVPQTAIRHDAFMVVQLGQQRLVRRVRKVEGNKAELIWFDSAQRSQIVATSELKNLALVVRGEFRV